MPKTLCDWSKHDIEWHAARLRRLTDNPVFFCRKCARVANSSKVLCKPRAFASCLDVTPPGVGAGSARGLETGRDRVDSQ